LKKTSETLLCENYVFQEEANDMQKKKEDKQAMYDELLHTIECLKEEIENADEQVWRTNLRTGQADLEKQQLEK